MNKPLMKFETISVNVSIVETGAYLKIDIHCPQDVMNLFPQKALKMLQEFVEFQRDFLNSDAGKQL